MNIRINRWGGKFQKKLFDNYLICLVILYFVDCRDLTIIKHGKTQVLDETFNKFPKDVDFDNDLKKPADILDSYDELVAGLPKFDVIKNGKHIGVTKLNIVTRAQSTWSTPIPPTKKGEKFRTWSTPAKLLTTKAFGKTTPTTTSETPTTATKRSKLLTKEQLEEKKKSKKMDTVEKKKSAKADTVESISTTVEKNESTKADTVEPVSTKVEKKKKVTKVTTVEPVSVKVEKKKKVTKVTTVEPPSSTVEPVSTKVKKKKKVTKVTTVEPPSSTVEPTTKKSSPTVNSIKKNLTTKLATVEEAELQKPTKKPTKVIEQKKPKTTAATVAATKEEETTKETTKITTKSPKPVQKSRLLVSKPKIVAKIDDEKEQQQKVASKIPTKQQKNLPEIFETSFRSPLQRVITQKVVAATSEDELSKIRQQKLQQQQPQSKIIMVTSEEIKNPASAAARPQTLNLQLKSNKLTIETQSKRPSTEATTTLSASISLSTSKSFGQRASETPETTTTLASSSFSKSSNLASRFKTRTSVASETVVTSPTTKLANKFAWSRSWSRAPNGSEVIKTWDSENGLVVETRTATSSNLSTLSPRDSFRSRVTEASTTTNIEASQQQQQRNNFNNNDKNNNNNNKNNFSSPKAIIMKPIAIKVGDQPHRGPTFNCKVLDASTDGKPSEFTDTSCNLSYPGFSSDGLCQCTYEVDGRDEQGCAIGYVYTCIPTEPLLKRRFLAARRVLAQRRQ